MATLGRACQLCLLLAAASAFPVYDVTAGPDLATNAGRGTSFTALGRFDSTRAIQCFADYGNDGAGTCNVLNVDGGDVEVLSTFMFNDNETHEIAVAPFSHDAAVVCFSDKGDTKRLICKSLKLTGISLSASEPVVVNAVAEEVPFVSLASLTDEVGILCWSYVQYAQKDRAGVCNKLTLDSDSGDLTVGADYFFDLDYSVSDISVKAFSFTSAVVCYSAQGEGTCTTLSLGGGAGEDFTQGDWKVFHAKTSEFFESLVTIKFTAERGAVCYADGTDKNSLECKVLLVNGTSLSVGADAEVVNENPTSWMTAAAITDDFALVCYATEEGGNVNGKEFRGLGTCNVLGLTGDNTTVGAGPPNEVNSNPTEHMSIASLDAASAVLCFSDFGAGAGYCMALSMAPTTTTTTVTTSTSTTSTSTVTSVTETSTTSFHTTTETSTSTETSTTSFHTTTFTETTVTTVAAVVDSGSMPPALLSAGAALAAALAAAANLAA